MLTRSHLKLIFTIVILAAVIFCLWPISDHESTSSFADSEHVAIWQKPLTVQINILAISFFTLLVIRLGLGVVVKNNHEIRFYYIRNKFVSISDYLKIAFSDGILNSKIY
jgi:hypothetical protein